MKRTSSKLFLYSLSSLAVMASSLASAETLVTAPTLEGGVSASIGALYLSPSSADQDYVVTESITSDNVSFSTEENVIEVNPDFDFGFEASLGYLFEGTANGVELLYRGINTSDSDSVDATDDLFLSAPLASEVLNDDIVAADSTLDYRLNAADLMFNQFLGVGTHVQMRFSAGASYLNLKKEQTGHYTGFEGDVATIESNSQFSGFGPRLAADGRYDFGQGVGILGGASLAYYIGDLDIHDTLIESSGVVTDATLNLYDDVNNHIVTNLRGNVGIDYVYFFDNEERSTLGVELGYLVDYYADASQQLNFQIIGGAGASKLAGSGNYKNSNSDSITFSGPYLEIKGVF